MFSQSCFRKISAAALQNATAKELRRAPRFVVGQPGRCLSTTTTDLYSSSTSWFWLGRSNGKDGQRNGAYERALPRHVPACGLQAALPQLRWFSADPADGRTSSYRQRVMDRASHMRESARDSYKEFREHPRESMRSGAKSFSGMLRRYGPVFVGTYAGVYFTTLGGLFVCVQSGLLDPAYLFSLFGHVDAGETKNTVDLVVEWMRDHRVTEPYAPFMEKNPYLANLAVAWIAVKFTEPIRATVALGLTPRVSRWLGYTSYKEDEEELEEEEEKETVAATKDAPETGKEATATSTQRASNYTTLRRTPWIHE